MKEPLLAFFRAVKTVEPELAIDDAADILWLALAMRKAEKRSAPELKNQAQPAVPPLEPAGAAPKSAALGLPALGKPAAAPSQGASSELPPARPAPRESGRAALYQTASKAAAAVPGLPFRTAAAPALPGKRALLVALRPLMRRIRSRHRQELSLADTLARVAEEGLWLPCLRPSLERWFEVAVLIECSPSMGMWQQLSHELYELLKSAGAFGAVRAYALHTQGADLSLYPLHARAAQRQKPLSPQKLQAPDSRTLTLVITDCVSSAWSDGRAGRLLLKLAGPVALVQVFPEHLLDRTALAEALPLWLRALVAGAGNSKLVAAGQDRFYALPEAPSRYLKLPVLTLVPHSLSAWARMLAAAAGAWVNGVALPLPERAAAAEPHDAAEPAAVPLAAAERVSAFRMSASPLARQLAQLMTVFRGPGFSLPILRLVRKTLLPQAHPHHEAEFLLSGLLEVLKESADRVLSAPEEVRYDFHPGVAELVEKLPTALLKERAARKEQVLEALTSYVSQRLGSMRDFLAVVSTLSALSQGQGRGQGEFARLSQDLLCRLGGRYAALTSDRAERLIEWSTAEHPRRNRVELAAYLGDPLAASLVRADRLAPADSAPLKEFLLGLRRFGTLVLADAGLALAEHFLQQFEQADADKEPWKIARGLLAQAKECLAYPSREAVDQMRSTAQQLLAHEDLSPQQLPVVRACADAATAAAVPWLPGQPHGGRVELNVLKILSRFELPQEERLFELRAAVSRHLLAQLLDPNSYLPPAWRDSGIKVLIAGDLGKLGDELAQTAELLGRLLASQGYDLLTMGRAGVERRALYAYVAELERIGGPLENSSPLEINEGIRSVQEVMESLQSTRRPRRPDEPPHEAHAVLLLGETSYVSWLSRNLSAQHKAVLPLPWTGREAQESFKRLWEEREQHLTFDRRQLGFVNSWWEADATVETQTRRAVHVLELCFLAPRFAQYRQFAKSMLRLLNLAFAETGTDPPSGRLRQYHSDLATAANRPPPLALAPSSARAFDAAMDAIDSSDSSKGPLAEQKGVPTGEVVKNTLAELEALLPAMRHFLAYDFCNLIELLEPGSPAAAALIDWLIPLVAKHAWPIARSALLSPQFHLEGQAGWLETLRKLLMQVHETDGGYDKAVLDIAATWAQTYLQTTIPEQKEARLSLIKRWIQHSNTHLTKEAMGNVFLDSELHLHTRIVYYVLIQEYSWMVSRRWAVHCLDRESALVESEAELRPLALLLESLSNASLLKPQPPGPLLDALLRLRKALRTVAASAQDRQQRREAERLDWYIAAEQQEPAVPAQPADLGLEQPSAPPVPGRPEDSADRLKRALTQDQLADTYRDHGQLDEALRIWRHEVLPILDEQGDIRTAAETLRKIVGVHQIRGQLDEALRILQEEELPAHERLGDIRLRAATLAKIGEIHQARGQLDEALRIWRDEALPVFERLEDVRLRTLVLGKIADVYQAREELDEALRIRLHEELPVYEKRGDTRSAAVALGKIADVYQARGQLDEALRIRLHEELPVYEKLEDVRMRALTLGKIADVHQAREELDEALRIRLHEELPVYKKLEDRRSAAIATGKIADICHQRGKTDEALHMYETEVLPVLEGLDDRFTLVSARSHAASYYGQRGGPGDRERATALLRAAYEDAVAMRLPLAKTLQTLLREGEGKLF